MCRTVIWTSITVLFFSLFQAAILSNLTFLPVMPDLVMLIIVYVSFMNASVTGATTGFISGLFLDFLSAAPIGLNAFTKTVTGFVAGKFSGSFNMSRLVIPALMGRCGDDSQGARHLAALAFLRSRTFFIPAAGKCFLA